LVGIDLLPMIEVVTLATLWVAVRSWWESICCRLYWRPEPGREASGRTVGERKSPRRARTPETDR